ncbi:MAG: hypothetical protein ICV77_04035 [Cyanobacteria bacterium Co-bin8]|nr:hypothetical protein [Cyanobacteria bacterium Co-bin8]
MPSDNHADSQRISRLYYFLAACLAIKQKVHESPNAQGIGLRLGNKELRKTISLLLQEEIPWEEKEKKLGSLGRTTTGAIVERLVDLRRHLADDYQSWEEPYTRVLTAEDVLTVLYKLIDLTPTERQQLKLPAGDGLTLLQRALLILQTVGGLENYEMLLRVYKAAIGLDFTKAEPTLNTLLAADELITRTVEQALDYLPNRTTKGQDESRFPSRSKTVENLTLKAKREIRRLLARSGNQQNSVMDSTIVDSYVRQYLQPAFVAKLAQSVVANERLTDQFPIYLKRITLTASGPLPFADRELDVLKQAGPYPPLLHPALRLLDQPGGPDLPGPGDYELASQEATLVTAEFYVKVPEGYQPAVSEIFQGLTSQNRRRIDFSLSSTGIGGALSHVIKVINRALLQDIPCLREYFSIAHDVTSTQAIIRDNVASPVWAHSLVKLCHKKTVAETLQACDRTQLGSYEAFAFSDPIGHGDYCGFDFLLAQAQAALQARLQAIRNAGVLPSKYVEHLCHRTERLMALQQAWSYFRGYPFSSLAMIGMIGRQILPPSSGNTLLKKSDPYVYFDACLSIVEALLSEGIYRTAHRYLQRLQVLDEFVDQGLELTQAEPSFEVFSGELIVRYLICLANYYYLYDTQDRKLRYLPPRCQPDLNRAELVQRAWQALDQAQQHISIRLRKYVVINEVSQGTFHPHYDLLGRIAFLRAKLLLFFPRLVPPSRGALPTERFAGQQRTEASVHWGRLYLAEKARLYAAADGNSEIYACYAAMQCWFHLMAAYTSPENLNLDGLMGREGRLSPGKCLNWARQLRDHALISYAETGRQCYYQIKEKSGLPKEDLDRFGPYWIEKIPAIYEARGKQYQQALQSARDFLVLDMGLLAIAPDQLPKLSPNHPTRNIYLFGTNACYLFFARGLYMLCSDEAEEFEAVETAATEPLDWDAKLWHAMRLLNMAWAIAEEGGEIHKSKQDGERIYRITRPLTRDSQAQVYSPPEVESIRDLYPRRVTEIADLGKIFAAACMVLRLSCVSPAEQAPLAADIENILSRLQNPYYPSQNTTLKALLAWQKRYNGHLDSYLNRATAVLLRYKDTASPTVNIQERRNALIRELFS